MGVFNLGVGKPYMWFVLMDIMEKNIVISGVFVLLLLLSIPFQAQLRPTQFLPNDFRGNFGLADPSTSNYTFGDTLILDGLDLYDFGIVGERIVALGTMLNDTGFSKTQYLFFLTKDFQLLEVYPFNDFALPQILGIGDHLLVLIGRQLDFPFDRYIAVYETGQFGQVWNVSYSQMKENFGTDQSEIYPVVFDGRLVVFLVNGGEKSSVVSYSLAGEFIKTETFSVVGDVIGMTVEDGDVYLQLDDPFYGSLFYVQKYAVYDGEGFSTGDYKIKLPPVANSSWLRLFYPISLKYGLGLEIINSVDVNTRSSFAEYRLIQDNTTLAILETNLLSFPFATDKPNSFRFVYSHSDANWYIPLSPQTNFIYNETQVIGLYSSDGMISWNFETIVFNSTKFGPEMQYLGVDYVEDEDNGYYLFQVHKQEFGSLLLFGSGTMTIDLNRGYSIQLKRLETFDQVFLFVLRALLVIVAVISWFESKIFRKGDRNISTFPSEGTGKHASE